MTSMTRLRTCAAALLCFLSFAAVGRSADKSYAVVIGNNAPPPNSKLSKLRYADNDAVRYYRYFGSFADVRYLLTIADQSTQRKYPEIASSAEPPDSSHLQRIIDEVAAQIEKDRRQGNQTILYFVFSGHGAHNDDGESYLALSDGALTHEALYDALARINADFTHLIVDACYAGSLAEPRGLFDDEVSAKHTVVSDDRAEQMFPITGPSAMPGLGILVAASPKHRTHEWSEIESGVFTHEVLSGLEGPADVNLDGKIEYSELSAFVTAAGRRIRDERGHVDIIAKPPKRNLNAPIVDLGKFTNVAFLIGDPSNLGHFFIELDTGERYLDANLTVMKKMHIVLPGQVVAYLSSGNKEARIETNSGSVIDTGGLRFYNRQHISKGSIESSLADGLFKNAFGLSYYLGYIDSIGYISVDLEAPNLQYPRVVIERSFRLRRGFAISGFVVSGAAVVAAATLGALSLNAKQEFDRTDMQVDSADAASRYHNLAVGFWAAAGMIPAGLLMGILAMPKTKDPYAEGEHKEAGAVRFEGMGIVF